MKKLILETDKKYTTRNGTIVLCRGRSKTYPANFIMMICAYPNSYTFDEYLVFEDGTDCWRDTRLDVVGEYTEQTIDKKQCKECDDPNCPGEDPFYDNCECC